MRRQCVYGSLRLRVADSAAHEPPPRFGRAQRTLRSLEHSMLCSSDRRVRCRCRGRPGEWPPELAVYARRRQRRWLGGVAISHKWLARASSQEAGKRLQRRGGWRRASASACIVGRASRRATGLLVLGIVLLWPDLRSRFSGGHPPRSLRVADRRSRRQAHSCLSGSLQPDLCARLNPLPPRTVVKRPFDEEIRASAPRVAALINRDRRGEAGALWGERAAEREIGRSRPATIGGLARLGDRRALPSGPVRARRPRAMRTFVR